jgi:molybdopterin-guanine dinucleotide biosynthesis protein A
VIVDAIVLTGGRSSRLGSATKSQLYLAEETLLRRTLAAASAARRIVVVGPDPAESLPTGVLRTREDPPFGGPAAGVAAGMDSLARASTTTSEAVLVFACDMPHVDRATPLLLQGLLGHLEADGVVPVDAEGHPQLLAAAYRTSRLAAAIALHEETGSLHSLPMRRLVQDLDLVPIVVPTDATADVDTWEDARRLGVSATPPASKRPSKVEP